jgi:hypothetical protein
MTATGNPDEYVGYITGYQGGSEIDYYVFGADESGHRYTQPVFAELDPHHFTVGAHAVTEPTINVREITFDEPEEITFTITNNTSEPFDITNIYEVQTSYLDLAHESLPVTLAVGDSFEVTVACLVVVKGYVTTSIEIVSSIATQSVTVNIQEYMIDAIGENNAPKTQIYPNPTSGQFTVEGADIARVEVYNLVGQKVFEAESQKATIDATNWNKGIYLVNITSQSGAIETKKLVVK